MRVEGNELRGRLKLAPEGTSPRIDEIRRLVEAKVLKSTSIGFMPVEAEPIVSNDGRRTGGMRYLRSELIEISLVSTPANPDALALARSMKISDATLREVFKSTDELTIGQRIRCARKRAAKARRLHELADTSTKRAVLARVIAAFEREEAELREQLRPSLKRTATDRRRAQALEVHAKALATLREVDERIAMEYLASPLGQKQQQAAETLAAFEAQARAHADPPKQKFEQPDQTWRGQKVPHGVMWGGKKV
jgi:methylphosphotriester-DNA--protein-cysteine methyltransferase